MEKRRYSSLVRHDGNEALFRTLELSILSVLQGVPLHFHAEGLRGTGKTTIIRAARDILPYIERIKGCAYNCHPLHPHCPEHRDRSGPWETEWIRMPLVEVSHSAKLGTVVGSIDLEKLTDRSRPGAALRPGTLAQAHRGIVLVDEINRLADTSPELADVLLDVMGTKPGRLQIEETGLKRVELTVEAAVWAASNPDEEPGPLEDIRRQLSDRFDLLVAVSRPGDTGRVREILAQSGLKPRVPLNSGQVGERQKSTSETGHRSDRALRARLAISGGHLPRNLDRELTQLLAAVYVDFGLESLRAIEAWQLAAQLSAMLDRHNPTADTLAELAPLVLAHRVDLTTLGDITRYLRERADERSLAGVSPDSETGKESRGQSSDKRGGSADTQGAAEKDSPGQESESAVDRDNPHSVQTSGDVNDDEASLWERLFDSMKTALQGQTNPVGDQEVDQNSGERAQTGTTSGALGRQRHRPGSHSTGAVERDQVRYRRSALGSPAAPGHDSSTGPTRVAAPTTRARLLRQLPVDSWVVCDE